VSIETDLADIDKAIIADRVSRLAASARAHSGQLQVRQEYTPRLNSPEYVLESHGLHRIPARVVGERETRGEWYRNPLCWAAGVLGCGAVACVVTGVVWIVDAVSSAAVSVGHAVASAMPAAIGVLALIALVMLCGRGGAARISGTFTGRIHR
jgi:hypothetical protein